jgi:type II secretory ATPase GspE/PulE/Tfp pilus assembly ATPase PilB-like protein
MVIAEATKIGQEANLWLKAWEVLLKEKGIEIEEILNESRRLGKPPIEVIRQVKQIYDYDEIAKKWVEEFNKLYGWDLKYADKVEIKKRKDWYFIAEKDGKEIIATWSPVFYPELKAKYPDKEIYIVPYYLFKVKEIKEEGLRGHFIDIIASAYKINVSDVHIEVRDYGLDIKLRLLGDLRPFETLPLNQGRQFLKVIKDMASQYTANFDPEKWQMRQDARIVLKDMGLDLRLAFTPSLIDGLQNLVIRLLSKSPLRVKSLEDILKLGYFKEDALKIQEQLDKSFGLFITSGPTGSGKSKTLNSWLSLIPSTKKILTVEDPVEYILPNAVQHQTFEIEIEEGKVIKMDYLEYLRAFMRQDPDVILVGEWRKIQELTEAILYASETGHLVFTTLHANRVPTIPNLLVNQYGVQKEDISNNINFLKNQRLVKKACPHCSLKETLTFEKVDSVVKKLRYLDRDKLYALVGFESAKPNSEGCEHCRIYDPLKPENVLFAGFSGRTLLYEYLVFDYSVRELVLKTTSAIEMEKEMVRQSAYIWIPKNKKVSHDILRETQNANLVRENEYGKLYKRKEFNAKTFIDTILEKVMYDNIPFDEAISKVL